MCMNYGVGQTISKKSRRRGVRALVNTLLEFVLSGKIFDNYTSPGVRVREGHPFLALTEISFNVTWSIIPRFPIDRMYKFADRLFFFGLVGNFGCLVCPMTLTSLVRH